MKPYLPANAPIFGVDNEGKVTIWNKNAHKLVGYSSEEVMGQNLVLVRTDVLIVVEMEEFEPIKVFLQFNKLALSVLVVEKK